MKLSYLNRTESNNYVKAIDTIGRPSTPQRQNTRLTRRDEAQGLTTVVSPRVGRVRAGRSERVVRGPETVVLGDATQVVEVSVNDKPMKSGVQIQKCRYLETSGCTGLCVNSCKMPTQYFFTKELGMPLTMEPNFEDMSCLMIFGQTPPAFEDDLVFKQKCCTTYCPTSSQASEVCPKLR
uniref:Beta-carotene isomerase D27-like C-terminal domain-containing protein n=1 Tax=Physcomitrium patens TaxID=3218 RepID=A0A7I4DYF2_PHYPA